MPIASAKSARPATTNAPPAVSSAAGAGWALLAVLLLSTVLDLVFFTGFYASDDSSYYRAALHLLNGRFPSDPSMGAMRLTIVGWNALVIWLVGPNVQLVAASYILWHQLLNLCTYALGARLFRAPVGLLAAWLVATLPLTVLLSTLISPDTQMAAWVVLSLLAWLAAYGYRGRGRLRGGLLMLLAGICVGLAYMTKESGLILLPFYFVAWVTAEVLRSVRQRPSAGVKAAVAYGTLFAGGVFLLFAVETATLSVLTGRPTLRMGWTVKEIAPSRIERVQNVGLTPLKRFKTVVGMMDATDQLPRAIPVVLAIGVLGFPLVVRRAWAVYLLPIWVFAYLTWGSMSLTSYVPPYIKLRYYIPVMAPLLVVSAAVLWTVWEWAARRIRAERCRTGLRWLLITVVIVFPLTWFGGANRLAGNMYRSNLIGAGVGGINLALESAPEPVILSSAVSRAMSVPLKTEPSARLYLAHRLESTAFENVAAEAGFTFVEFPGVRMLNRHRLFGKPAPLDWLIRAATEDPLLPLSRDYAWDDAHCFVSVDPACESFFQIGRYRYFVRKSARIYGSRSRWTTLRQALGLNVVERTADEKGRAIDLFRVRCAPTPRDEDVDCAVTHDLTPSLPSWRVRETNRHELSTDADGNLTVQLELPRRKYAWVAPPPHSAALPCELTAAQPWEFHVDLRVEGGLKVLLVLPLRAEGKHFARKSVQVRNGYNRFGIWPGTHTLEVAPAFQVWGSGTLTLKRFEIIRVTHD